MAGLRLGKLRRRDRETIGVVAVVLGLLIAGALALSDFAAEPLREQAQPDGRGTAPSPVSEIAAPTEPAPKVQERAVAPAEPFVPNQPAEIAPPYLILDGLTFSAGLNTFTLAGLEGPPAAATCQAEDGHRWACGLQARAALNNAIQKHALTCVPVRTTPPGAVEANCTAGGADVGGTLVAEGWARPLRGVETALAPAAAAAEREKRGLWRSGWTYTEKR